MGYIDLYMLTAVLYTATLLTEIYSAVKSEFTIAKSKNLFPIILMFILSKTTPLYSEFAVIKLVIVVYYLVSALVSVGRKSDGVAVLFIQILVSAGIVYIALSEMMLSYQAVNGALLVSSVLFLISQFFIREARPKREALEAAAIAVISSGVFMFSKSFYPQMFGVLLFNLFQILTLIFFFKNMGEKHEKTMARLYDLENRFHRQVENEAKRRTTRMTDRVEKIREISLRDPLTKVLNRAGIDSEVASMVSDPYVKTFSLALIDLDKFKEINDTHGHIVGDETLKFLADFITKKNRRTDILGRFGGDEFLLMMPNINAPEAMKILDRIRREIDAHADPHFTISVGIATYPYDGHSLKKLLLTADKGAYLSKEGGRNAVSYAGNVPIIKE